MIDHTREAEAAKAALDQLTRTALLTARRGQMDTAHRILVVLQGHGTDGVYALLEGMADAVLAANAADQNVTIRDGVIFEPDWHHEDGTPASEQELGAGERWCGRFMLARGRRDAAACRLLVDGLGDEYAAVHAVMVQLTVVAARTVNMISGAPQ